MTERMIESPLGPLTLTAREGAITRLEWRRGARDATSELLEAEAQLAAYFDGTREVFDLPLRVEGSEFQRRVCDRMRAIGFGETVTYGDIARDLDVPAQAVGAGCGGNPIPILIPCHRVLGAASLGGFSAAGGVETKVWLLRHEGAAGLLI
ncbi:methylated-DNA--[protein]-cysteine S-methyltransferase [Roseovarius sp. SCSIO 43702]|uniref:methylated-DNA--[protein]-cysteine S-methyltransferase n=1 Tax=Roseovarius sp. SCSIO 43702 TaxID=2823043 RepID=UPI001C72ACDE|nr:methylated-DNA--[protein]-cysteine S-methyltransferase [Roseovarius sp. SCSIO 43702]QYX56503.1 methylated-DNA--[protein]-cysteine S-methyltransferase [Roseovarius sp. SCSIO 43702]